MAKRNQNPRLAKIHRSYKVDEIADLYGTHKNTVLNWIKQGLPTFDNKRPLMILGSDLNAFHAKRRVKNKHPCKPNEIYCIRCRTPKEPAGNMAEYQSINETLGNLVAICPDCELIINRRVNLAKLEQIKGDINISFPQVLQTIS
jgi:hypothetical protein